MSTVRLIGGPADGRTIHLRSLNGRTEVLVPVPDPVTLLRPGDDDPPAPHRMLVARYRLEYRNGGRYSGWFYNGMVT